MEHSVRLDKFPEGLRFPSELKDRVTYDETRKRLVFRGFMCKADYDRLALLSDGVEYRRAIDELFVRASDQPPGPARWAVVVVGLIVIGVLAAALACWWWLTR